MHKSKTSEKKSHYERTRRDTSLSEPSNMCKSARILPSNSKSHSNFASKSLTQTFNSLAWTLKNKPHSGITCFDSDTFKDARKDSLLGKKIFSARTNELRKISKASTRNSNQRRGSEYVLDIENTLTHPQPLQSRRGEDFWEQINQATHNPDCALQFLCHPRSLTLCGSCKPSGFRSKIAF